METNAKPRGRPVSRSVITATSSTWPWAPNSACNVSSVVEKERLPTYSFISHNSKTGTEFIETTQAIDMGEPPAKRLEFGCVHFRDRIGVLQGHQTNREKDHPRAKYNGCYQKRLI